MGAKKSWRRISMSVGENEAGNWLNLNGVRQSVLVKKVWDVLFKKPRLFKEALLFLQVAVLEVKI
jgi:hypothetical protein